MIYPHSGADVRAGVFVKQLVVFEPSSYPDMLDRYGSEAIAWALQTPISEPLNWGYYMPAVWSQYLRESNGCTRRVCRRRIRTEQAVAWYRCPRRMRQELQLSPAYTLEWLPELQSLQLEYTTNGVLMGVAIVSQACDGSIPLYNPHRLRTSHPTPLLHKSTPVIRGGILDIWEAGHESSPIPERF